MQTVSEQVVRSRAAGASTNHWDLCRKVSQTVSQEVVRSRDLETRVDEARSLGF